ncbi:MAG: oligopeptide transporter, OPT family [Candidatus Brocadiae bacterium]|nr:oligopeptide transporter, OPT family [Candidatus Brocadiia bacterium]
MDQKNDLTVKAIVVGLILSVIMAAANMYIGMRAGMTISANIPCSVIAILIFTTLFRSRSISEVNLSQATGSVGEGLASGVIFVFPALVFSGVFSAYKDWTINEYLVVIFSAMAGGMLGIVLSGFLRRPMVVENQELKFPEGVATAEILKTGMAAFSDGKTPGLFGLIASFVGGIAIKLFSSGIAVMEESVSFVWKIQNSLFKVGTEMSAALVGVGFIIEFNGAFLVVLGGALAWLVFIPIYTALYPVVGDASISSAAEMIWKQQIRYIGVGGMIVGGIWSIFKIRKELVAAIKGAVSGLSGGQKEDAPKNIVDVDLSKTTIKFLILIGLALAGAVYFSTIGVRGASVAFIYTLLAVFFFVAISVYIVGLIGSTNQPVSGITICTFLLAAVFIFLGGIKDMEAVKTILLIAGTVCVSACLSGSASQNFKTAMVVGSSAKAVQTGLLISLVFTSFLTAPLLVFLDKAFTIGSEKLRAPQASMFSELAKGLFIQGAAIPWNMVIIGIGLGILLILIGIMLKRMGSSFGISPMAVAVGIYLPFATTLPILLGGIVHLILTSKVKDEAALNDKIQRGTVLSAGLVAGEAITGIIIAVLIAMDKALPIPLISCDHTRQILSVLSLISIPVLLHIGIRNYRSSKA